MAFISSFISSAETVDLLRKGRKPEYPEKNPRQGAASAVILSVGFRVFVLQAVRCFYMKHVVFHMGGRISPAVTLDRIEICHLSPV